MRDKNMAKQPRETSRPPPTAENPLIITELKPVVDPASILLKL